MSENISSRYVSAGVYGTEYVVRNGHVVPVRRVAVLEEGGGWECRDADGSGPLRVYTQAQLFPTREAAENGTRSR